MSSDTIQTPESTTSNITIPDQEMAGEPIVNDQEDSLQSGGSQNKETRSDSVTTDVTVHTTASSLHGILAALSIQLSQIPSGDQLIRVQELIQTHLPTTVGNPAMPIDGCPLLELIPIECRKEIWEYLLYNPLLSESYAADGYGVEFELSPAILRVNKQTYNEGIDILYGRNRFLVQCIPQRSFNFGTDYLALSALTRYQLFDRVNTSAEEDFNGGSCVGNGLASLCRNIYMANIQSIDVLIIPRGIERDWGSAETYVDESQLALTFKPLERLRNIQQFTIRAAEFHEIPMDRLSDEAELADEFTPILPDPVDEDDMERFKLHRTTLIQYLEPHYEAIEAASIDLVDLIKSEKRPDGFFDHEQYYRCDCVDTATEAMLLLEDYASSFARRLERGTRLAIRKQKLLFDSRYDALPREQLLRSCEMAYEKQWWNRFVDNYKKAVNDMDTQYLAIREARRELYAWDLPSTVRETAFMPSVLDGMIGWDTYEPDMRVNEAWIEYRSYAHSESPEYENDHSSDRGDHEWN
ncbi:uncharacterized protein EAF01_007053 [Botrytis porri]|uniref:Uncharacterized protein n=1 Tax=Botrytis porri TaxID=87229 RepID=A0A4Z1KMI5_9HELO|nr:uncharacterized protein EAF01_007053 [Botrytis porri]KAF7901754.1 hypothetical protein EAF01_007053 [Botrytis porri]TGO85532.1 hypothetical protein BPOR_0387g00030 [Botrytis porri]